MTGPVTSTSASLRARVKWLAALAALVAVVVLLLRNDPSVPGTFPPCPFWWLTGIYCPGCGSTRGLHALLHGMPLRALDFNPLLVIALPFLGLAAARWTRTVWTGHATRVRPLAPWLGRAIALGVIAFWVLRNIPLWPFSVLAP